MPRHGGGWHASVVFSFTGSFLVNRASIGCISSRAAGDKPLRWFHTVALSQHSCVHSWTRHGASRCKPGRHRKQQRPAVTRPFATHTGRPGRTVEAPTPQARAAVTADRDRHDRQRKKAPRARTEPPPILPPAAPATSGSPCLTRAASLGVHPRRPRVRQHFAEALRGLAPPIARGLATAAMPLPGILPDQPPQRRAFLCLLPSAFGSPPEYS